MISSPVDSLRAGAAAIKAKQFGAAIAHLEVYCNANVGVESNEHYQAQIWLIQSYKAQGRTTDARHLCFNLSQVDQPKVKAWASEMMTQLPVQIPGREPAGGSNAVEFGDGSVNAAAAVPARSARAAAKPSLPKAERAQSGGVTLLLRGAAANLALVSGMTLFGLFGMALSLICVIIFIQGNNNPLLGLGISTAITLLFSVGAFFISPLIMDWVQRLVYGTQWTTLEEIDSLSPESAQIIRKVCKEKQLKQPRLGIINDQNPTAFTYGSLPNSARLVVSRGLFTYLDDDEVATVYAHELGHIVHWDFAVMTLAATLVQLLYLIYSYSRDLGRNLGNNDGAKKIRGGLQAASLAALVFFTVGEYLQLYLSRTREYYADHFAAEVTGNPNGLSRALVKISYGIVEEGKRCKEQNQAPSKVLQGMRALGISDAKNAGTAGTAYRVAADSNSVGLVFLWDMFNPWAKWMELNSTHPLTGKRVRALGNYAEQLDLNSEFDMVRVVRAGNQLDKKRLYGSFVQDVALMGSPLIGGVLGLVIGIGIAMAFGNSLVALSAALLGLAMGILLHAFVMYPKIQRPSETDILTLMSDAYASPLRGKPVKLKGEIIGRGDAGGRVNEDFQFKDKTGMVYLDYSSRFGALGNFFFGWSKAGQYVGQPVSLTGWFRRGIAAKVDLNEMECDQGLVKSYHRFGKLVSATLCIVGAVAIAVIGAGL